MVSNGIGRRHAGKVLFDELLNGLDQLRNTPMDAARFQARVLTSAGTDARIHG